MDRLKPTKIPKRKRAPQAPKEERELGTFRFFRGRLRQKINNKALAVPAWVLSPVKEKPGHPRQILENFRKQAIPNQEGESQPLRVLDYGIGDARHALAWIQFWKEESKKQELPQLEIVSVGDGQEALELALRFAEKIDFFDAQLVQPLFDSKISSGDCFVWRYLDLSEIDKLQDFRPFQASFVAENNFNHPIEARKALLESSPHQLIENR